MALTKITKHIIYGSTLIGHYGRDISDVTTTSGTYVDWDELVQYTPQYADSNMEICFTGAVFSATSLSTTAGGGNCRLMANGAEIYTQENAMAHRATQTGTRHYYNPRFSQHNARQQFHAENFGTGIYMTTVYHPNTVNQIGFQCQAASVQSHNCVWQDGYMTATEISGPGHNLT